jgi:hypothetical protein
MTSYCSRRVDRHTNHFVNHRLAMCNNGRTMFECYFRLSKSLLDLAAQLLTETNRVRLHCADFQMPRYTSVNGCL